jgi:hypothetical protein
VRSEGFGKLNRLVIGQDDSKHVLVTFRDQGTRGFETGFISCASDPSKRIVFAPDCRDFPAGIAMRPRWFGRGLLAREGRLRARITALVVDRGGHRERRSAVVTLGRP